MFMLIAMLYTLMKNNQMPLKARLIVMKTGQKNHLTKKLLINIKKLM